MFLFQSPSIFPLDLGVNLRNSEVISNFAA